MSDIIYIVLFLMLTTMLNAYLLLYIYKLRNIDCECANTTRRKMIQAYLISMIFVNMIVIFIYLSGRRSLLKQFEKPYLAFVVGGGIVYSFVTYQYVEQLKKDSCLCSDTLIRIILQLTSLVTGVFFSFTSIIIGIAVLAAILYYVRRKMNH